MTRKQRKAAKEAAKAAEKNGVGQTAVGSSLADGTSTQRAATEDTAARQRNLREPGLPVRTGGITNEAFEVELSKNDRRILEKNRTNDPNTIVGSPAALEVDRAQLNSFLQEAVFGASAGGGIAHDADLERDEKLRSEWCGLKHPDTKLRQVYDYMHLVILLYLAWALPNRLAFSKTPKGREVVTDLLVDIAVWLDIIFNRHHYYYDHKTKQLVTDPKKIKHGYMRSWFLIDFLSVVPADQVLLVTGNLMIDHGPDASVVSSGYIVLAYAGPARMLRLLRMLRLVRLTSLLQIDKIVQILYGVFKNLGVTRLQLEFYFRVVFLLLSMLASGHGLGCLWLMIGRHNILKTVTPSGWMLDAYGVCDEMTGNCDMAKTKDYIQCIGGGFDQREWNLLHGALCFAPSEANKNGTETAACSPVPPHEARDVDCTWLKDKSSTEGAVGMADGVGAYERSQYLTAFYFALVTLSSVGYGDITPATPAEKGFVVMAILVGAFLYAYIIGEFSDLISNMKKDKNTYDAKMRAIADLLGYIDAPIDLRTKIFEYYEFKFMNKEGIDIIHELPKSLQTTLIKHRWGPLIERVPFFRGLLDGTILELCKRMEKFTVCTDDYIMVEGAHGNQLLILAAGKATTAEKPQDEDDDDDKEQKDENGEADVDVGDEQTTTVVGVTEEFEDSYIDDDVQANIAAMRIQAVQRGRMARRRQASENEEAEETPAAEFGVGTFWGELEFIGLGDERQLSIKAVSYCEVASLSPVGIADIMLNNPGLRHRLEAYGAMRKELEEKLSNEAEFDVDELMVDLQNRYDCDPRAKDIGPGASAKRKVSTNQSILGDIYDLKHMNEVEIQVVNDRMNSIEATLEEAVQVMRDMENNAIAAVQDATTELGNLLIGQGFQLGGKRRLFRKRRARKTAQRQLKQLDLQRSTAEQTPDDL